LSQLIPLEGKMFGNLTVLKRCGNIGVHTAYTCKCSCGNIKNIRAASLKRGDTKSCGCLRKIMMARKQMKHGMYNTPTYRSWSSMIARCTNPMHHQWKDYGGRGIKVCEEWTIFENFFSDMGERPKGKSIDRIDNDKGYNSKNCKWSTRTEQNRNKRNSKGI